MSIFVGIINGKAPSGGSGGVSDADLMNLAVNFLSPGVVGATDVQVVQQATANNTVKVKAGKLYAKNAAGSMVYPVTIDADVTPVTITNNPSGNPLIGAVYLKIDTATTPNNLANNVGSIGYLAGTAAASPVAPTDAELQTAVGSGNVAVRLGEVNVVAGFTSAMAIDSSKITDKRTTAGWLGTKVLANSAANALITPYVTAPPKLAAGSQETGACGLRAYSYDTAQRTWDTQVNFKTVMTNVPSSITLTAGARLNLLGGQPVAGGITIYGFRFSMLSAGAIGDTYAIDFTYTTVGN